MTRARTIANFGDGIATADIGDGQITTAKIASDAITSGLLPAGSVLQVVHSTPRTSEVTTTTNAELWSKSVTPLSSSSTFYIFSSWNTRNTGGVAGLVDGTLQTNAAGRGDGSDGFFQEYSGHNQQSFHWKYANSSLTAKTFSERVYQLGANSTAEIWSYGYMFSIIMEVSN